MINIVKYQEKYNEEIGRKKYIESLLKENKRHSSDLIKLKIAVEKAQTFLQQVAQSTQDQLRIHIRDIVQMALDSCWPGEIDFDIIYEVSRGKTEARLSFKNKYGDEVDPYDSDGGGLVDIASLGLRIAAWTLGRTDNCIILDEPFKNLDNFLRPFGAEILKNLSEKLGLQFLIITHDEHVIDIADKIFSIRRTLCSDGYYKSLIEVKYETKTIL